MMILDDDCVRLLARDLQERLGQLDARRAALAEGLLAHYTARRGLTAKQVALLEALLAEADFGQIDPAHLYLLAGNGRMHRQRGRVRMSARVRSHDYFVTGAGLPMLVTVYQETTPIAMTADGLRWRQTADLIAMPKEARAEATRGLALLCGDPEQAMRSYGARTTSCALCGNAIADEILVRIGIHGECANEFGVAWP